MQISSLYCRHFRMLTELEFQPSPGINIIYGANAQGKTSLLEALLYAATTRSHRTASDMELVQQGHDIFAVTLEGIARERPIRIDCRWWRGEKRFKVNGVAQARLSEMLGRMVPVFFSPEDIALIKGPAAARRLLLDMDLSQLAPAYLRSLQHYRQALRQRNELLRNGAADPDVLAVWESQLAEHGAALTQERGRYVAELSASAADLYAQIVEDEPLQMAYRPDVPEQESLLCALQRSRKSDMARRTTGRGPHRDEIDIHIAGLPARAYGSQGQQKSAALVLKLAETDLIRRRLGEYPVILLDEAMAELDEHRASRLLAALPDQAQVMITTAQPERDLSAPARNCRLFSIQGGRLEAR